MADKFYDGMPNVNEKLNEMDRAFAAGPYNALPISGGTLTGPLKDLLRVESTFIPGIIEMLRLTANAGVAGLVGSAIKMGYPSSGYGTRMVSGGDPTLGFAGYTAFETGNGGAGYAEVARFSTRGSLLLGTPSDNGTDRLQVSGTAKIAPPGTQGSLVLRAGIDGANPSMVIYAGNGDAFGQPASVLYVAKNDATGRGITTPGTLNTQGNDYAEYMVKDINCGFIQKGQLIGISANNTITEHWDNAVMFAIKSTSPSYVGGDSWADCVGPRPEPQAGPKPAQPMRRAELVARQPLPGTNPQEYIEAVTPGDTDAEWAERQAAYAAVLAAHDASVQLDTESIAAFEAALEADRQKVDRIAIAGRVPVNVLGAQPGDYIVPVKDGTGIKGVVVHQDDLTMKQYLHAVGRVISIEADGRAYVMVKVV